MMGRKQKLIDGLEEDVIYARKIYCYLKNRPSIVKWAKRKLNKRWRQELKKEDAMNGTNPGAWPDDWHGDVDDGKRKAFAELDKTIPLYTAADLKAARIETVERCIAAVKREERADVEYLAQPANVVYNTAIEHCMRALHTLKEKINAS